MTILGVAFVLFCTSVGIFSYYYIKFGRMIDARLSGQIFQNTSRVYAAPERIFTGESMKQDELETYLVRAGYSESEMEGAPGQYATAKKSIEVRPSKTSYFNGGNALRIDFEANTIAHITSLGDQSALSSAELEPQVMTNLFDTTREKRRLERFDDLPKILIQAVLSAEDKRFFEHGGFDTVRILGAAWADVRRGCGRKARARLICRWLAASFLRPSASGAAS